MVFRSHRKNLKFRGPVYYMTKKRQGCVTRSKTGLMLPKHISAQMTYANLGLVASVAVLAVGAALSAHN